MSGAQLLAAGIGAALTFVIVVNAIRWRTPSVRVVFLLMFGLPTVGFVVYAVEGGPAPDLTAAVVLAVILYAAALFAAVWSIARRTRRGRPTVWNMATDARAHAIALATRLLGVVWISALLFLFEPGFAVANVALSALWMVLWLPRRFRTFRRRTEVDIAALPETVFEFVRDVRNWRLYRDDMELVSVIPDGPLLSGSEYVARVAIPESFRRTSYQQIESRYHVQAFVPGKSFDVLLIGQSGRVRTVVEPAQSGSRLSRTSETTMGLLRAWSADMLNNRPMNAALRSREQRDYRRLREILEAQV